MDNIKSFVEKPNTSTIAAAAAAAAVVVKGQR